MQISSAQSPPCALEPGTGIVSAARAPPNGSGSHFAFSVAISDSHVAMLPVSSASIEGAASVDAGVLCRATELVERLPIASTAARSAAAVGRSVGSRRKHSRTMCRTFDSSKAGFGAASQG